MSPRRKHSPGVKIKRHQVIIAALIVLGLTFLVIGVLHQNEPVKYYAHSLRTWQEADSVAGYPIPVNGSDEGSPREFKVAGFEPNLSSMAPLERFRLPVAHGFLPHDSADAKAAATGLVLYTGNPDGYPGEAVLLGHRLPDGSIVQTFYHGLRSIRVRVGQHLPRGTTLGDGGTLREVRAGTAIDLARETIAGVTLNDKEAPAPPNRLDLQEFLADHRPAHPSPDPLIKIQEEELEAVRQKQNIQSR